LETQALFAALRTAIATKAPPAAAAALTTAVDALEHAVNKPTLGQRYKDFISLAADHMSIISPFMPALGQLLSTL
jgi:hypothetical protein